MEENNFPLVSVITPVYNGAPFLNDLIISVQKQTYPVLEHIIIDDGSSDGGATLKIVKKYSHLRWWTRENLGQYATMNEGLQKAAGEIICFISADDFMLPDAVSMAVEYLSSRPNYICVYGNYSFIDVNGKKINYFQPMRYMPTSFYPYSLHIAHSSLFIRRRFLVENSYYFNSKLRYVGDYEWIIRFLRSGKKIGRMGDNLSYIRLHEEQTSNISFYEMRREILIVQKELKVSPLIASLFRKVLFISRLLNIAGNIGFRNALKVFFERISIILKKNENNISK